MWHIGQCDVTKQTMKKRQRGILLEQLQRWSVCTLKLISTGVMAFDYMHHLLSQLIVSV